MRKKIIFLTGTRADYGKIKSILLSLDRHADFELFVFVTGMHMHKEYGSTYREVLKDGYTNIFTFINQRSDFPSAMDITLSNTIEGFSAYVQENKPDMVVVHGDRIEALAATIVGAIKNITVAHIEGGEVSGTIDESIRHAITKMAHVHFVANEESRSRIKQLGEDEKRIFVIGSPDIDIMISPNLPTWEATKKRYDISFDDFGIVLFHPVTTSYSEMAENAKIFMEAVQESGKNYIVIHPNNDTGRTFIVEEYEKLVGNPQFRVFTSVRFEHFLTMLKNATFIVGNSSAGVREASYYGTHAIDIGDRQKNRYASHVGITHTSYDKLQILSAIKNAKKTETPCAQHFGAGNSTEVFMNILSTPLLWELPLQKHFIDRE